MKNKTDSSSTIDKTKATAAMKVVIDHNVNALEVICRGEIDITSNFTDRLGFHSLVSLICETDVKKQFKNMLKRILKGDMKLKQIFGITPTKK